jgi:hypothetical protein
MRLDDVISDNDNTPGNRGRVIFNRSGKLPIRLTREVGGPGVAVAEVDESDPTPTSTRALYSGPTAAAAEEWLDQHGYALDPDKWY